MRARRVALEALKLGLLVAVLSASLALVAPLETPPQASSRPPQMHCFPSDATDTSEGWEFCPDQWDYEVRRT